MEQPNRKKIRLDTIDYSANGAYFVTVCTQGKEKLFGEIGENSIAGQMVCREFEAAIARFPHVHCSKYVVMPNHFHALLIIEKMQDNPSETIMDVLRVFKSRSTVEYIRLVRAGKAIPFQKKVWQRSFYDHVVRNEWDYQEIWKYIDENPMKWQLDKLYVEE